MPNLFRHFRAAANACARLVREISALQSKAKDTNKRVKSQVSRQTFGTIFGTIFTINRAIISAIGTTFGMQHGLLKFLEKYRSSPCQSATKIPLCGTVVAAAQGHIFHHALRYILRHQLACTGDAIAAEAGKVLHVDAPLLLHGKVVV